MDSAQLDKLVLRILQRIKRNSNNCWIWQGPLMSSGYGIIFTSSPKQSFSTHRVMLEAWLDREIRIGMEVHHICENKRCCNPKHMREVTHAEHMKIHWQNYTSKKTHCPKGHPYSQTRYLDSAGRQRCRVCQRKANAVSKARRKVRNG